MIDRKLGELVEIQTGKLDANAASSEGQYPFFTCAVEPLKIDTFSFDEDAVLVAGNGDLNVKHYVGKFDAYQRTYVITSLSKENLNTRYLYHFLSLYVEKLRQMSIGGVIKYIKLGMLTDAIIKVPSQVEQERISLILDKANFIKNDRHESLDILDDLEKAIFLEMFGDPILNTKNWKTLELGKVAQLSRGRFSPRPRNDPSYYNGAFPFVQTGDVANCGHRLQSWKQTLNEKGCKVSKEFKPGTILIAIVGATIGATAILEINAYAPDSLIGIEVDTAKVSNIYLEMFLRFYRPIFVAQAPETARANINLETLRPVVVPLPPIELQKKFEEKISHLEEIKSKCRTAYSESESLVNSLLSKFFH